MSRVAQWFVYAAAALLATVIIWFTVWSPAASAVVEAQDRVDSSALQQGRVGAMVASAQRFAAGGAASVSELERVRTAVPESPELAAFLLFIDDTARSTGCIVRALNPRPDGAEVKAPAGMVGIGVDLVVVGPMDQVQAFLVLVSRLPRAMLVDEFQINPESDRLVELSIVARIFRTGTPDAATEPGAPAVTAAP